MQKRLKTCRSVTGFLDIHMIQHRRWITTTRMYMISNWSRQQMKKVLMKELMPALEKKQKKSIQLDVTNIDRTFGTIFGSEITKHCGEQALEEDTYVVKCNGAGGQSFGAFIPKGLTLQLVGDSNDYFGKGLVRR